MADEKQEARRLTSFEIRGLHGDRDVRLELSDSVKILVDANGSGKTTVLNTLYYILTYRFHRLARVAFEEISLTFDDGQKIRIPGGDMMSVTAESLRENARPLPASFQRHIGLIANAMSTTEFEELFELARRTGTRTALMNHRLFRRAAAITAASREDLAMILMHLARERSKVVRDDSRDGPLAELRTLFPYQVLYFPTYRRVEEELHTLGYSEPELPQDDRLIQFGMEDVKQRLAKITTQIRDSSVEWYSKVNGRILTELIDGIQVTPEMRTSLQDAGTLRIVLDRVGENIDEQHKEHILELIRAGRISEERYSPLVYFLSNLAKVYEQQREKDNLIKDFVRVANSYLDDKEVVYNESKLQIGIIHKRTGRPVDLERLSSGEKQIVSIFSRLYLAPRREYVVLFDEPELSLSIEWQKRLLEDIRASNRCKLLVAATHSPFIFENSLDCFAGELIVNSRITERACEPEQMEGDTSREEPEE